MHPHFQVINRLFGLWGHTEYFLPKVKIIDYKVMIDGQNLFDQPVKNDIRTYDNIRKIASGQGSDYTTNSLLDYPHFKEY